jgi:hypothetical protein
VHFISKARPGLPPQAKVQIYPNYLARQKIAKYNFKFCNKMKIPPLHFANQLFIMLFLSGLSFTLAQAVIHSLMTFIRLIDWED